MSQNESNIEAKKALESQISQIMLSSYYSGRSEGIDIGAMSERERIIKLLEEDTLDFLGCGCCAEAGLDDFIALIKGENS